MSMGERIPLAKARLVADHVERHLRPHAARVQVAGSVRRRSPTVGDIEMVVEPHALADMFGEPSYDVERVHMALSRLGPMTGHLRHLQVPDVCGSGVQLDLYMAYAPAHWGSILAIRTGPALFSRWCMQRLIRRGLRHRDGRVVDAVTGEVRPTPDEPSFFALCGMDYLEPWERTR